MRAAFVLFEGLPPTVIDSQVFAHVRLARETLGIDFAIVAIACSRAVFESSHARLACARDASGGDVVLKRGMRPALLGSMSINHVVLARALAQLGSLAFVHARADYAAAVCGLWGRRNGVPVLWDCRGDSLAELRERLGASAAFHLRSLSLANELRIAGATCAGALFVTPQLSDLMSPLLNDELRWVVPCLAPEADFFFDPALRARVRKALAITPEESVYIYSGSLTAYQRFEETLARFRAALRNGKGGRLIVLTPEVERARQICAALPASTAICKAVPHSEVNGYLNAADFGFLLRDSTPVNAVAFPTKFAEYAMAGLKIVMKEAPPACVALARELGIDLPVGTYAEAWPETERTRCAAQAAARLGRRAAMPVYAGIYERLVRGRIEPIIGAPVPVS